MRILFSAIISPHSHRRPPSSAKPFVALPPSLSLALPRRTPPQHIMLRLVFSFFVALVFLSASSSALTILHWLKDSEEHSVFLRLLPVISLDEPLGKGDSKYTVIAPTNDAFARFVRQIKGTSPSPEQIVTEIEPLLQELGVSEVTPEVFLRYHAVSGSFSLEQLENKGNVTTLAGGNYFITANATAKTIDDLDSERSPAPVSRPDIALDNGYIHVVMDVLLPVAKSDFIAIVSPTPSTTSSPTPTISPTASISPSAMDTAPPQPSKSSSPTAMSTPVTVIDMPDGSDGTPAPSMDGAEASADPSDPEDDDDDICFPASARVTLACGKNIAMKDLTADHQVKHSASGASRVFLFTHRTPRVRSRMVRITTSCGHAVTLSASHYVRTPSGLLAAKNVAVDGKVETISGSCKVVAVERVAAVGLYAPHTLHGDIVVDGVVASSYAQSVHPRVAHALLLPIRFIAKRQSVFKEPLGGLLYNGAAKWVHKLIPRGSDRVSMF